MTNELGYEEETKARLAEARTKQNEAENIAKEAQSKAEEWKAIANAYETVLVASSKLRQLTVVGQLDTEHMRKQSTWDSLLEIMKANNGMLVVNKAVTTLVDAGVFTDREHARNVIYSTLYSHKKETEKIRHGIYRLKTEPSGPDRIETRRKSSMSFRSGIAKVLQDAHGEALHANEIWKRMQAIGVVSNSKEPTGWIDRMAHDLGDKVEKVAGRTWRWKIGEKPEALQLVQSAKHPTN